MKIGRVYANFQEDFWYAEHYLAKEMAKKGHTTVFITSDKYLSSWSKYLKTKEGAGIYERPFYKVHRLKAWAPLEKVIYRNPVQLWRLLFNQQFDVLHLNAVGSFSTVLVLWMVWLKGKSAPPVVISDHTDTRTHSREGRFANLYYHFFRLQLKFLQKKIARVVTFGEVGIQVLSPRLGLPVSLFNKIPLGFDQEQYTLRANARNQEEKMIIGYAGKITPHKRVDFLIESLASSTMNDRIKLIIVGVNENDPYCSSLKTKYQNIGLTIEWRPFANRDELAAFYNYIDLAIYPGGISITTIEANACGAPVLIFRSITGLENRVENGRGKLFTTKEELLLALDEYYQIYMTEGMPHCEIAKRTLEKSSWEYITNDYLNLYNNLK